LSQDYKSAGVDIQSGDDLVDWLLDSEKSIKVPHADRIASGIGGFASLFRISNLGIENPCLVSCTDGVGTKVKLAVQYNRYAEVAQDCVAMCVNDLICCGADPLFFLDYYATGKLRLDRAKSFLQGIRQACAASDCALVGGETAEMPGVYDEEDFDCAGFAVGVVDEKKALGPLQVRSGDCVIGVSSSGFHSNGYSLIRKVFAQDMDQWIEEIIRPTHLYVKLMKQIKNQTEIHAAAHITGGGMQNVPRVLPPNFQWRMADFKFPNLFNELQTRAQLSREKMLNTFNCGIGFALVLPKSSSEVVQKIITENGFQSIDLGNVTE
jgi:phosphoribosylformylglycinamidine cyclo-ligase